ncbi:MAG: hypothetical protein Q4A11_03690 [Brachymonas sp.]|nr:hypothetical protein [Brachymonas sp.]
MNPTPSPPEDTTPYPGEMVILRRDLEPTQAHLLGNFLRRCGIAAETDDADLVRIVPLRIAFGGAKIRVPQLQVAEALELLAAFERGEFALDDNGESESAEPAHP